MQVPFTSINGSELSAALLQQAGAYMRSTIWTSTDPWLYYDHGGAEYYQWTGAQATEAVSYGLFDTTQPVVSYNTSELGTPFVSSIWSHCHGLLGQTIWTMPIVNGEPTTLPSAFDPTTGQSTTTNLTYTEDWIQQLVQDAYKQSPLYWHYPMRHAPSQSTQCSRTTPVPYNASNYWYGTLGGQYVDCYCGWSLNATHCQIPQQACAQLVQLVAQPTIAFACSRNGIFLAGTVQLDAAMQQLGQVFTCPSMMQNVQWGLAQNPFTAYTNASVQSRILNKGPSGLRVGATSWQNSNLLTSPLRRLQPLAQPLNCTQQTPESLADHFVDELFPAAQGVRDSIATSACVRFTIELARLTVYTEAGLDVAASQQSNVVQLWRQRCEVRLEQVTFCHVYGVYDLNNTDTVCPFTVDARFTYSITPGCLLVYEGAVYDPCLCDPTWCGPGGVVNPITMKNMVSQCRVMHVRDLVIDQSIQNVPATPPWPAASSTIVPRPLARSTFQAAVIDTVMPNLANTAEYWATAEGGTTTNYCDLVVDWWPEAFEQPVGYHVTVPCTGAAYRTFDSAWAQINVGSTVQMWHTGDSLRNDTLATNNYGASGACRTNTYGMAMDTLNPMRICTQADNSPADPTVPTSAPLPSQWGTEFCTTSPLQTPWQQGVGAPSGVGTLPSQLLNLLPFNSWGTDGPTAQRYCKSNADCATGFSCLLGAQGLGVCAVNGQCFQHHHCSGGLMCSGDGSCVPGLLEVQNAGPTLISVRTHSSNCTCSSLDMWGVSKEQAIPDILESSGMCSYRSWFEHRMLQSNNVCSASMCGILGSLPWNFSAPSQTPQAAFASGVLKVQPHACDRDYEHYTGLLSCYPTGSALLTDGAGNTLPLQQVNKTRTWTQAPGGNAKINIAKQPNTWNEGAGFLGSNLTYTQLGYGSVQLPAPANSPRPVMCEQLGLCLLQSEYNAWYVNGQLTAPRLVLQANVQRSYNRVDMMSCGSMGYMSGSNCMLDSAVVPLFFIHCNGYCSTSQLCNTDFCNGGLGQYAPNQGSARLAQLASELNGLFGTLEQPASTWTQYLAVVDVASGYWTQMQARQLPQYPAGAPMGLYYLLSYGAYEVPFAWWFRCGWLGGLTMSTNMIDCPAWDVQPDGPQPLMQYLASLSSVYTTGGVQMARNAAHQLYSATLMGLNLQGPAFGCYQQAAVRQDLKAMPLYAQAVMSHVGSHSWGLNDGVSGECTGFLDCLDHGSMQISTNNLMQDVISELLAAPSKCNSACSCTNNTVPAQCSWMQDYPPATVLSGAASINLFQSMGVQMSAAKYTDLPGKYANLPSGCSAWATCPADKSCACLFPTIQPLELMPLGMTPQPTVPPWLIFSDTQTPPAVTGTEGTVVGPNYLALDICKASASSTRCNLTSQPPSDSCAGTSTTQSSVQGLYCGANALYTNTNPQSSQCVKGACLAGSTIKNRYVSVPTGLTVTAYNAVAINCYRLSCPGLPTDGMIVTNTAQYVGATFTMTTAVVTQIVYGSAASPGTYQQRTAQLYVNGVLKLTAAYTVCFTITMPFLECNLNNINTRSLSADYTTAKMSSESIYNNAGDSNPVSYYENALVQLIKSTEDRYNSDTTNGLGCMQLQPAYLSLCNYTTPVSSAGMLRTTGCTNAQLLTFCTWLGEQECAGQSTDICAETAHGRQCGSMSPWTACMNTYVLNGAAQPVCIVGFGVQCNVLTYQSTQINIPCTANTLSCPYDAQLQGQATTWEQAYVNDGLPSVGFCPDCTALDGSCPLDKSTQTYETALKNSGLHNFTKTAVNSPPYSSINPVTKLGADAMHFMMQLGTIGSTGSMAQCNVSQCGNLERAVEIYKDLYVCTLCQAAPTVLCTGKHNCGFSGNLSTYNEALAAVQAEITTAMSAYWGSVQPVAVPWMQPNNFAGFNPTVLALGFNTIITDLPNGQCSTNNSAPDFSQCSNDVPRRTLKAHVNSQYKVLEGTSVPAGATLTWNVGYAQMTGTNIPAFETARPSAPFMDALFNDSLCATANFSNLVCMRQGNTIQFWNPAIAGDFEIQVGCDAVLVDSTRIIEATCNLGACQANDATHDMYNMMQGSDTTQNWMQCRAMDHQLPLYYTTPPSMPTNLCGMSPALPTTCPTAQGTLAGAGNNVADLYTRVQQSVHSSAVLDGTLGKSMNMSVSPYDIGGNYVRMQVLNSKLSVVGMPLRAYNSIQSARLLNTSNWVRAWTTQRAEEQFQLQQPASACTTWQCPLRRWWYWTGQDNTFRPWSPQQTRTSLYYNSTSHPTTQPARLRSGLLSNYQTRNGFCISPTGQDVSQPTSGPCSVADTTASLSDGQQRTSQVFTTCAKQVDWPLVGGQMRDSSYLANPSGSCGVLDRLPAFKYRYACAESRLCL